jgi:hypothetical protein
MRCFPVGIVDSQAFDYYEQYPNEREIKGYTHGIKKYAKSILHLKRVTASRSKMQPEIPIYLLQDPPGEWLFSPRDITVEMVCGDLE